MMASKLFEINPPTIFLLSCFILFLYCSNGQNSETIILHPANFSKIKIKFDFDDTDKFFKMESRGDQIHFKNDKEFDTTLINSLITEKLEKLKEYLLNEKSSTTNETDEIVLFDLFTIPINHAEYKLNISIDTLQISGITGYIIQDISTNEKSKKISALLRMPIIQLSMFYKANGFMFHPKTTNNFYSDKGKITYTIRDWRTVFAGKIIGITKNNSQIDMTGFGIRSHYNYYESNVASFNEPETSSLIDIGKLISSGIMKKVINEVDDRMENIMLEHLGIREVGNWFKAGNDYSSQKEEDGQMLMMESKIHQQFTSRRRNRRQVPCETGDELDEYVDSLFRFVKRLVRVMEPFSLPNATIELEEYNLQIFLHSGGATQAYTFERKKPAWVLCQNDTISLGLTVGIEDLRINYKYRVIQDWRLMFDGDLEAQIRRPKAQVQITQLSPPENEDENFEDFGSGEEDDEEEEEQVQQRIDKLKVWKPGQIVVLIRGLGNFSSALSMLINQMLTDTSMLDPIIKMLETDGVVMANEMLKNVSIPIFSII